MWLGLKRRRLQLELKENIACKDEILKEYKGIRHEYNNMLQSIICFIEEEDWEGLKNYKGKLLEKTEVLNGNNLTQLVKLKNKNILSLVYKLLIKGKESKNTINLTIYNDIEDTTLYKIQLYKELEKYLDLAYEVSSRAGTEFNLKISGNKDGIRFAFENTYYINDYGDVSKLLMTKRKLKNKRIFFNTFIQTHLLIQEVLISN